MSPRRAAVVVAVVALPVLVASVVFLPTGGAVSVLSALGMAAGLTGVGLAMLWATRSSWKPEPAPSPRSPDRSVAHRRAVRVARVQGCIGIVGGLGIALLALGIEDDDRSALRLGAAGIGISVLGAATLVLVHASGRKREEEDAASDDDPLPSGWILVSRRESGSWLVFAVPTMAALVWGAWQFIPLFVLALRGASPLALAALGIVAIAAALSGVVWGLRQIADVCFDTATARVRVGSRTLAASDLTTARVSAATMLAGGTRSLFLILEGPGKLRVPLLLRRHGRLAMDPVQRRAAVALVEAARIAPPRAKEDPRGRFSRTLFPTHLDAAQARELVAHPPRSDEDLPIAVG